MKRYNTYQYVLWVSLALLLGTASGSFFLIFTNFVAEHLLITNLTTSKNVLINDFRVVDHVENVRLKPISYNKFSPPKFGKQIYIDTVTKTLFLFNNGKMLDSFNIVSIGGDNSASMLVAGDYNVIAKEKKHRSAMLNTMLPNSVAFSGNFFIHGIPTRNNISDRKLSYSVTLEDDDATKVFEFADTNTGVSVSAPVSQSALTVKDKEFLGFVTPNLSRDISNLKLPIKAKAFVVRDLDTGEKIFSQKSSERLPIASVTKLVTAMVVLDNLKPDEIISISKRAVATYGHQGNLSAGEKFKAFDLLNCMLLESSNDAAEAFAEHLGRNRFLSIMNSKVQEIGMADTKYDDPSGLSAANVSTPEDLSKLIEYIEKTRPDITSITTTSSYKINGGKLSKDHVWINRNRLIRNNNSYYVGGKDGFTGDALMTFVGAFSVPLTEFDHKRFSIALLRSSDRNGDVDKIINKIISSLQYKDGTTFESIQKRRRFESVPVKPEENLSLMFVGDIMLDRGVKQMIDSHGGGDFAFPFEYVPFLKDPDILFGNLEGPVSNLGYDIGNKYSFRMDPRAIAALADAGFDALSVANNHIGDWGLSAFEDTLDRLRHANILAVGGGISGADARSVKIIEKNGIKIGFIGFSDVGPNWLSQKDNLPSILSASDANFDSIVRDASKKVDHLVVSFHFGEEYSKEPTERQRTLAHRAIDDGARIVIGHHPHVSEAVEKYNGGVIVYSLGNFIFDQPFSKETMTGDILEVVVDKTALLETNESQVLENNYFQPSLVDGSGQ